MTASDPGAVTASGPDVVTAGASGAVAARDPDAVAAGDPDAVAADEFGAVDGLGAVPAGDSGAVAADDAVLARLADALASPLDPVLSDPTRLRIQAALHALPTGAAMSFTALRKTLNLTDGNLGMHVRVLVDAGFVGTEEQWRGRRRTTLYQISTAGRAAFEAHVRALRAIIDASTD